MIKGRRFIVLFFLCLLLIGFLYLYSPRYIEFLGHYDKVFAHRVNSLEKLEASLRYFDGVELDLVYDETEKVLDVNHPPAKSIGLTFKTYLSKIPENTFPFLWLDIKDLDIENAEAILVKLNTLFETRNYPKIKVLVETKHPEALPIFTKAGYKTSYYLPELSKKTPEELVLSVAGINEYLVKQPLIGISTSEENYNIIAESFPEKTKYMWYLKHPYDFEFKSVRALLEDERVVVVLSSYRSFSGNR